MKKVKKETCCAYCMVVLEKDEIALSKKLFGEDVDSSHCLSCTTDIVGCELSDLKVKIQEFKEQGCALFL